MGSLMAGWDSPVSDPKKVYRRNKSLTHEEIQAYWKSKKRIEEEHLRAIANSQNHVREISFNESTSRLQRSSSMPQTERRKSFLSGESEADLEKFIKTKDWWTRSNWAFLNEPPVTAMDGPSYKYASQYHVANLSNSKPDMLSGISA